MLDAMIDDAAMTARRKKVLVIVDPSDQVEKLEKTDRHD
jgi:hypothetical protein